MAIETLNKFAVSVHGEQLLVMNPPRGPISKADALLLAAWLVAMAIPDGATEEFDAVLEAVKHT